MSKRLEMLQKMTRSGSADAFAWYALALEYAGLGQTDDALQTFSSLRESQPGYVPMYLMCGTMLVKAGRVQEGRDWLSQGVAEARAKGDTHALGELQDALAGAQGTGASS